MNLALEGSATSAHVVNTIGCSLAKTEKFDS